MQRERAVSSVVAVVLMVAVTVIMAAAVGSFALDIAGVQHEPVPQIANADAELVADVAGGDDQTVRIAHRGGDTVTVSNLEVVVTFSDSTKRSRLTGVPTKKIDSTDYDGDDIWDGSYGGIGGALASNEPAGSDGEWSSGEALVFRIANGDVSLDPGDRVTVTVVHEPSGKVILERTLTASTNHLEPSNHEPTLAPWTPAHALATPHEATSSTTSRARRSDRRGRRRPPSSSRETLTRNS